MENQTDKKTLIQWLKVQIDREHYFAYDPSGKQSLEQVVRGEKNFRRTRMDAERDAESEYRRENPQDQDDMDVLLDENKIQVWDLREMLEREE